jgi:hypothetical protein
LLTGISGPPAEVVHSTFGGFQAFLQDMEQKATPQSMLDLISFFRDRVEPPLQIVADEQHSPDALRMRG